LNEEIKTYDIILGYGPHFIHFFIEINDDFLWDEEMRH